MARERACTARPELYRLLWKLVEPYVEPLEPESRDVFLSHFTGEKKEKMLEAEASLNMGDGPIPPFRTKFSGFQKMEKSLSYDNVGGWHKERFAERKPRFICAPNPVALFLVGPYTHRQTKWLSEAFRCTGRLFYAGCATPDECDDFLNRTRAGLPEGLIYVDDISAIDANHSMQSFEFHEWVRKKQFGKLSRVVEALWNSFREVIVRIGDILGYAFDVNASGVPDTSYKNSLICLFLRLLALAHAVHDLQALSELEQLSLIRDVLAVIYTSAAGDDGYSVVPPILFGTDMQSTEAQQRYIEAWAWGGFGVKLSVVPPHRWRMATYLAARPTWAGEKYVWTPEPARRLKSAWWQIDSAMHPKAWGRGIATQLSVASGCHPLIRPLADWYLSNTSGPAAAVDFSDNPFCPWLQRKRQYQITPRAIEEFCLDYRITAQDYERFLSLLGSVRSVYVNFSGHIFQRVFDEES
jgi:hypothetical protein